MIDGVELDPELERLLRKADRQIERTKLLIALLDSADGDVARACELLRKARLSVLSSPITESSMGGSCRPQ